jgi:hypothetical protein
LVEEKMGLGRWFGANGTRREEEYDPGFLEDRDFLPFFD